MSVSIIVTSYNYGEYIERCLQSCLEQNMPSDRFEVVVVDDCSGDSTLELLRSYRDVDNLRYKVNRKNTGVAEAANIGIRMARGEFVVRVDADDYISPNFAASLSGFLLQHEQVLGVSCDYHHVDEKGQVIERKSASEHPISCGIMYRKDLLKKYGLYNREWRHREEEELRRRLGNNYSVKHLEEVLYHYVMHNHNKTKQLEQMEEYRLRLLKLNS